jgi:hypothetical protein
LLVPIPSKSNSTEVGEGSAATGAGTKKATAAANNHKVARSRRQPQTRGAPLTKPQGGGTGEEAPRPQQPILVVVDTFAVVVERTHIRASGKISSNSNSGLPGISSSSHPKGTIMAASGL